MVMSASVPVSIIIPTLNEESYLPDLLQDLAAQSSKNFEVIIVDGKSDDKTKEKALAFKKQLPLQFIEVKKRKVAYQRNIGAQHAKGKYLFFLDADTRIDPTVIARAEEYIKKKEDLLFLPYPKPDKESFVNKLLFMFCIKYVTILHAFGKALSFGPAIVIDKELFDNIGGFDELAYVSEDHNLIIKAHKAGAKAALMPDVKFVFSMRRFESQGTLKILRHYVLFSLITLYKGAVYDNKIKYQMDGKSYKKLKKT